VMMLRLDAGVHLPGRKDLSQRRKGNAKFLGALSEAGERNSTVRRMMPILAQQILSGMVASHRNKIKTPTSCLCVSSRLRQGYVGQP
jgi:hypothetical protein